MKKIFLFSMILVAFIPYAYAEQNSVLGISVVNVSGGRVDWGPSGNNPIVFDRMGSDGYFDIWTMKPDGSEQVCLNCDSLKLPQRHIGNPVWHPSGEFIVFQAQKENVPKVWDPKSTPGSGILNDLWAMTPDGKSFWKLYNVAFEVSRNSPGVLHPHFSHNGKKVIWSERIKANGRPFG